MEIRATTASHALPLMAKAVLAGNEVGSRKGERVLEILHQHVILEEPCRREILTSGRHASLPAQIAETMWVFAGRNDIEWLGHYLPRAKDFSDDGLVWRGGYGPRLRGAFGAVDQLAHVVNLLKDDPLTRRAVISLYDPAVDCKDGLDIPCNDFITLQSRLGQLHMSVTIRSNDLIWGWSGINAFEWSALQEVVAGLLGIEMGELHFFIASLHVYDRHWAKAREIVSRSPGDEADWVKESPRFKPTSRKLEDFDTLVEQWFEIEEPLRLGMDSGWVDVNIERFPEPMLKSWLQVLQWWWREDRAFMLPLVSTGLELGAALTPPRVKKPAEPPTEDKFFRSVSDLHREKHAVYGDSWKKRGEQIGILANIARKVDRLGEAGAGDTSADTAVDLLVYLLKYRLWLTDERGATTPSVFDNRSTVLLGDGPESVDVLLGTLADGPAWASSERLIQSLKGDFEELSARVAVSGSRHLLVDRMIPSAFSLAKRLWLDESEDDEDHGC